MKGETCMGHELNQIVSGTLCPGDISKVREAVCIQTEKVYDQVKEKDCVEDARVFFRNPEAVQPIINNAINVKIKDADILNVFTNVEPVPFKRGFFTVDIKFFIRVTLQFFIPRAPFGVQIVTINGLIVFDKKVILFGSEGGVKIFKSKDVDYIDLQHPKGIQDNLPTAKVEVADPIALTAKIVRQHDHFRDEENYFSAIPESILDLLGDDRVEEQLTRLEITDMRCDPDEDDERIVLASVGLFSIIKMVRNVQLLIPAFDFCVPNRSGIASTDEEPCAIFDTIDFPVDEFFPPQIFDFPGALDDVE
jgi:hypothetical protein